MKMVYDIIKKIKIYGFYDSIKYICDEIKGILNRIFRKSYSQRKEDLIIDSLLGKKEKGFYVDVGAYDPVRFSNTKRFYDRGWTGINIEPNKDNYRKFVQSRPKDINLNIGIGERKGFLMFYKFFPDTLSTFSSVEAESYENQGYILDSKSKIKVLRLRDVLNEHAKNEKIDFISIDTEGYDMFVLQSNNWKKFRPKVICVESGTHSKEMLNSTKDTHIDSCLKSLDYKCVKSTGINNIYLDSRDIL